MFGCCDDAQEKIENLEKELENLRFALNFYAERTVYERLNQFPGDEQYVECSAVAKEALEKT